MTKLELIEKLLGLEKTSTFEHNGSFDRHKAHIEADALLLDFIGDPEIKAAYESFDKWYS